MSANTLSSFLLGNQNPQQVTSSSSTSSQLPSWLTQYSQGLIGSSSPLVGQTTSNLQSAQSPLATASPYLGSGASTLSSALSGPNGVSLAQPSVNSATGIVNNAINPANSGTAAASPYMSEANQTFSNPATVSSYMSPYLNDVTAYNTDLANQNLEQNVIPAVESQSIANGQFGSSPMGTALGQQIDLTQQNLQAQNLAAANQGYQEAGTLFDTDAARQGTLAQLAGTLGTQQQGAELQGASTLGSLGTALGQLGNTAQSNALTGAGIYGSLGSAAGQLGAAGNTEQLSQLGLLTSMTGVPGGQTTTTQASNPNPYSEMLTAGNNSSTLGQALQALTGSSSGLSALQGLLGGNSNILNQSANDLSGLASSTGNDITNSLDLGAGSPDMSSLTSGLSYFQFARGGHVDEAPRLKQPSENWHTPHRKQLFMAADGGAVTVPSVNQDLQLAMTPGDIYMPQFGAAATVQPSSSLQSGTLPLMNGASTNTSALSNALGNSQQGSSGVLGDLKTAKNIYNLGKNAVNAVSPTSSLGSLADLQASNDASVGSLTSGLSAGADPVLAAADAGLSAGATGVGAGLAGGAGSTLADVGGEAINGVLPEITVAGDAGAGTLGGAAAADVGAGAGADVGAASAGDAGAAAGSIGLGTAAGALGVLAVPLMLALTGDPNTPTTFNNKGALAAGMSVGKLPSGNALLENGDIGIGGGTQTAQGSNQIYNLSGGKQTLLPSQDSSQLISDYTAYNKGMTPAQVLQGVETGGGQNGIWGQTQAAQGLSPTGQSLAQTPAQQAANKQADQAAMQSVFNSTGGEKAWGVDAATWTGQMMNLLGNVTFGNVAT